MVLRQTAYILLGLLWLLAAPACGGKKGSGMPPMRLTLSAGDAQPLGGKVCRQMVKSLYPRAYNGTNAQPFASWYADKKDKEYSLSAQTYFIFTPRLHARQDEVESMYEFVQEGNNLLVAANYLSEEFEKEFGLTVSAKPMLTALFARPKHPWSYEDTRKYLPSDTVVNYNKVYPIFYERLSQHIDTDSLEYPWKPISFNHHGVVDGVEVEIGEGSLLVITNAAAFSNYFLLTGNNYAYADEVLQRPAAATTKLTWDEFYHRNTNRPPPNQGLLHTLLSIPPLKWAFWLLVALSAIFLITAMIRRQRLIPVKEPNNNTTVEFTQTIARLYFSEKDNRNIAQKMVQHFLEHLRSRYYMPTATLDASFATLLAHKTNISQTEAAQIVGRMALIQSGTDVTDEELLLLNRDIMRMLPPTQK